MLLDICRVLFLLTLTTIAGNYTAHENNFDHSVPFDHLWNITQQLSTNHLNFGHVTFPAPATRYNILLSLVIGLSRFFARQGLSRLVGA